MADVSLCKRMILMEMLSIQINSLFREYQDYHDCLIGLSGQEIRLDGRTYVFEQVHYDNWTLSCFGEENWVISFKAKMTNKFHGYDRMVNNLEILSNSHSVTPPLIGEIMGIVSHVLCTYHPNGKPLKTVEGAANA